MKPLEKLAVLALLTFAFCGCTRTSEVKTDEKLAVHEEVHEKGRERTSETVQTGPETITTTVEEYEEPQKETAPEGAVSTSADGEHEALVSAPRTAEDRTLPRKPLLVKRTVVVDQRGPSLATKTEVATQATQTTLHEKQENTSDTKKATKWGLPWAAWLIGGLLVAGTAYAAWRFGLLGKAMRLLG